MDQIVPRRAVGLTVSIASILMVAWALPWPSLADRRPFAPADTEARYMPERQYDLEHLRLELAFDWENREVSGTATNILRPLLPGLASVTFHAAELEIQRVTLGEGGRELAYTVDPGAQTLTVVLDRPYGPEEGLAVAVEYRARPRLGLYFVGPDDAYPDKPRQIWSQGETEYNRYWFPSWDYPNDRATTELKATVKPPFQVVGNGRLLGVTDQPDGRRTFHWRMDEPHVVYLVSVVVGELVRLADSWREVPMEYYVPPGYEDKARRSFGKTPEMMEFFSTVTDFPYPYAKYAQTCAVDFLWGGMENITATTQTLATLHDERAALDVTSDGLVAHELAHQWFGDLLTCRSWSHIWLNEGFATYFDALYHKHAKGPDEFAWKLDQARQRYLEEDRRDYRRPIVTERYQDPLDLFDAHTYPKGALVLHMIRHLLGDEGWWRGIQHYVAKHAHQTVTTADLQTALEEATGVPLGLLFDQYVYGAGHPELKVSWRHLDREKLVRIDLEQTQEITRETGYFSFPVEVGLVEEEEIRTLRLPVRAERLQTLYVPAETRPLTVVLDPGNAWLKEVDFSKPAAEWIVQLRRSTQLPAKLEAIRALGKEGGPGAVVALGEVLAADPFYATRAEAAKALGRLRGDEALEVLRRGLADADSRVRTAVLEALGKFSQRTDLLPILEQALVQDPSYYARAAAAGSLGKFREETRRVTPILLKALAQESHREVVRSAALGALAELNAQQAYGSIERLAAYGSPPWSRGAALRALAVLARQSGDEGLLDRTRRTLERYLQDPHFQTRMAVYDALGELGDRRALLTLQERVARELDPRQKRAAERAIRRLTEESRGPAAILERVEELERTTERLQREIQELKGRP